MNGSGTATTTTTSSLEMMLVNCTDAAASMTVLERQRARFRWQHQLLHHHQQLEEADEEMAGGGLYGSDSSGGLLGEVVAARSWKPDPVGWPGLGGYASCDYDAGESAGFDYNGDVNYAVSRTSSSLAAAAAGPVVVPVEEMVTGVGVGREPSKKRKAYNDKVIGEEESRVKRSKGGCEEDGESKITDKSSNLKSNSTKKGSSNTAMKKENSAETSKDNNSKVTEVQKPDYIHVRARRGQATDSHSLAERVRREKISERMKYLQDLVPGCNKVTGKAGMLDEIINYVQSLQRQVEFLSMKLAAVNPRIDINVDSLYPKEGFPSSSTDVPMVGMSPEMANAAYLQLNSLQQQIVACCGLDVGIISPPDLGLRRTISAPVSSIPETFIDSTCFNQLHPTAGWDADLQNIYNVAFDQGRSTSFPPQPPFTGQIDAGNLKMEL